MEGKDGTLGCWSWHRWDSARDFESKGLSYHGSALHNSTVIPSPNRIIRTMEIGYNNSVADLRWPHKIINSIHTPPSNVQWNVPLSKSLPTVTPCVDSFNVFAGTQTVKIVSWCYHGVDLPDNGMCQQQVM